MPLKTLKVSQTQIANEDIIKELQESNKWIPEVERNSNWYFTYLNKVTSDIKKNLLKS